MFKSRIFVFFATAVLFVAAAAQAQDGKCFVNADGVANNGYDVVAYFSANEAQRGSSEFTAKHDGTTYWFSSAEHQELFKKSPDKYLPQYGGYCAFAIGKMEAKVPVNPETFKVVDGKLYLFFNDFYEGKPMNTVLMWNSDEKNLRDLANSNWRKM